MKLHRKVIVVFVILGAAALGLGIIYVLQTTMHKPAAPKRISGDKIALPTPRYTSTTSVEEAMLKRRSVRDYRRAPLTLAEVSQLLWAAQGITDERGFRTAPSAGATYPLEVYLLVGQVEGLAPGVYRYVPQDLALTLVVEGDRRAALADASLSQAWVRDGAISLVFTAIYERTTDYYGYRGTMYVHMEVGHASQNVYLQAVALGLGTVAVGAFDEGKVKQVLALPERERPLYIMPVGRPR